MLTRAEAIELVLKELASRGWVEEPCLVSDEGAIEKPYGWVFFYNTKRYIETGEIRYALAGNGPVIVNKHDGTIEFFGMANPVKESIAEYEKKHGF